jgi:hypothetical protein
VRDGWDIDAAEVESLRQEITNRISLMNALVALQLAALGTGLTISGHWVHVLAGLAAISSFLWLLWIDQSISTYKLAAYLAIEMAPKLSEYAGRPVLGWEYFLRQVEAGGERSARALYGDHARGDARDQVRTSRSVRADWYVPLLFGCTPPLLLTLYVAAGVREPAGVVLIVASSLLATLLWIFTVVRFTDFVRNTNVLDQAIIAAGDRADTAAGDRAGSVAVDRAARPARPAAR